MPTTELEPRPTTHDDLPSYRTQPVTLLDAATETTAIGSGLLAAVEQLVAALHNTYGKDDLVVNNSGQRITVSRIKSDAELDDEVRNEQRSWDRRRKAQNEAAERAHLDVGDPLDLGQVVVPCSYCSLPSGHVGDHYTVWEGRITEIKPRN